MKTFKLILNVWRQKSGSERGQFVRYDVPNVNEHMSFLEMLDVLNETLIAGREEPIAFDHDCREGICGMCGFMINGVAHGPERGTTVCQLHMRHFHDGQELWLEPWRARAFPVVRDLMVDRSAFDRIIASGGFISVNTGGVPDGNALPIGKTEADRAMDAAACIACGACIAACPNGSAMLFVAAKVAHLHNLPQGQPERMHRTLAMVTAMDEQGFGNCSNHYECVAACPKEIPRDVMALMNRDYAKATFAYREREKRTEGAG